MLTSKELAAELKVSPSTIVQWARQGRIPQVKINAKIRRFILADVIEALKNFHEGSQKEK